MNEATRALVTLCAAVAVRDPAKLAAAVDAAAAVTPAEHVEEALLQSYLFVGFPAALNALSVWRQRSGRPAPEEREPNGGDWGPRGRSVCRTVYGSAYEPLLANVTAIQPELARWMLEEGYGKVLGRPGLDLASRELCNVALLAAQPAAEQLYSHMRGALHAGASAAAVEETLESIAPLLSPDRFGAAHAVWARVRVRHGEG